MARLFGAKLSYLRQRHNLTQVELGERLGLAAHAHISYLEAGRRVPSIDLASRVATLFHVSLDYLLRDTIPVEAHEAPDDRKHLGPGDLLSCNQAEATHFAGARSSPSHLFSRKLLYLRSKQGMNQTDLARRLGLHTQSHLSRLETGRKEPSVDMVLRIADLFGVTTDYLLRDAIPVEAVNLNRGDPRA